jgi:hypothetical protein
MSGGGSVGRGRGGISKYSNPPSSHGIVRLLPQEYSLMMEVLIFQLSKLLYLWSYNLVAISLDSDSALSCITCLNLDIKINSLIAVTDTSGTHPCSME